MSTQFATAHGALAPVSKDDPPDQLKQERREERLNAPRLEKFLHKTLDAIAELDQAENLKQHNEMVRCIAYYDGRWDGKPENGVWVDNKKIDGEIMPSDNEFKKQIDKLQMEMCRARIKYEAEAVDKFNAAHREAAQFATRRIEVNQERIETDPFLQAENQSLLLKSIAFRYSFFDKTADSREKSIELQVMQKMTESVGVEVCRTCETTSDGPYCKRCGDTERKQIAAPESSGFSIEQKEVPAGRVVTVKPDATMVQLDLNARDIQSSPFIRWRLVLRRCDWEAMFPNTRIPSSDESTESRHRSESQNQPSNSLYDTSSDDAGGGQFEKIEGELVWLDPKVYQRYVNKETERLGGGQSLPQGAKLVEQFPDGLCVTRIQHKVLDLHPSNKNKTWTLCVYGLREHALYGSGTSALLGPQDIINEQNAAIVAHHAYYASGREFVRSGAIEGGNLPAYNQVGIVTNAPEDKSILEWAYGRTQPEAMAGDVYGFRSDMKGSIQDAAGTSSLSNQGAADLKILGTATGVEASRDQAVGRMIPNRKLQAFAGSEWAVQALELEHENYSPETFLGAADKTNEKGEVEFTERGVKTFFELDVRTALVVKSVEGSWVPTTPAQDRANAADFATVAGQIQDPQMLSTLAPKFNIDYDVNEWGAAQRSASIRLEEYARVAKAIAESGQPPTPEMAAVVLTNCAEWAQVNPEMDNHAAFQNFYRDWWQSDEARNADGLLRMVVQEVFRLHRDGVVTVTQQMNEDVIKSELPNKVAQVIESDVSHDIATEHAEEDADLQDQREIAKMSIIGPQQGEPPPA